MPFIPNELDAFSLTQSSPDSGDFEILRSGSDATGIVSGCAVTAQGTPDMTVAVAAGVVAVAGSKVNVAAGNVTITAAHATLTRHDLIVVNSAGAKSAVAGTPIAEMDPPTEPGPVFPAIPASSVVLAAVYVPAADTTIASNQITDKRVFVIPPQPTTNYDLAKARDIPLVKERSQTVTLDTGENLIHGTAMADGKLFATTQTDPCRLIRFNNLEDLTDRTDLTFTSDGLHQRGQALVYVAENDRLYVLLCPGGRVLVAEVNPSTLAPSDVINTTGEDAGTNGAMCSDGTHLYIVTRTSPAKVLKYRLSDFGLAASVTLTGRNQGHAILYDGTELFATGDTSPGWVARVNPGDLTYVDAATTGICTDDLASVGEYLFIGQEFIGVSLVRVDKANLATQEPVYAASNEVIYSVHYDGQSVWVGYNTTPGQMSRVDPHTLEAFLYTFPSGEDAPNEILSDGQRLFVTFWMSPAKVKRFVPPPLSIPRLLSAARIQLGTTTTFAPLVAVRAVSHVVDGNVGSSEETLLSSSIPGGTLSADGRLLRVTASGRFAANANAKRILIKFGLGSPVTVFDTGSLLFNDAQWWLEAICVKTASNAQDWVTKWTSDSSLLATDVQHSTSTQTDTGSINVLIRGVGVSANDTTNEFLLVEVLN